MKKPTTTSFKIPSKYLCSVLDVKPMRLLMDDGRIIEGTAQGFIDHPKFTEFRQELERLGFIKIEPSWWNGDKVLTNFKLNGSLFKKGEPFLCASALGIRFQVKNKNKK